MDLPPLSGAIPLDPPATGPDIGPLLAAQQLAEHRFFTDPMFHAKVRALHGAAVLIGMLRGGETELALVAYLAQLDETMAKPRISAPPARDATGDSDDA